MIAMRNQSEVLAIGNDVYEMFEKTPQNVKIYTPVINGRISDVFQAEAVLHTLLNRNGSWVGYRPRMYFAVPTGLTQIEKRAYYAVAHRGKLRKCKDLSGRPADRGCHSAWNSSEPDERIHDCQHGSSDDRNLCSGRCPCDVSKQIPVGGEAV